MQNLTNLFVFHSLRPSQPLCLGQRASCSCSRYLWNSTWSKRGTFVSAYLFSALPVIFMQSQSLVQDMMRMDIAALHL